MKIGIVVYSFDPDGISEGLIWVIKIPAAARMSPATSLGVSASPKKSQASSAI
jgi:hypothetical protein